MAQTVKNLLGVQETWVAFLGWEAPLEKGMAIHSSILVWKIPWMEKPGATAHGILNTAERPLTYHVSSAQDRACIY